MTEPRSSAPRRTWLGPVVVILLGAGSPAAAQTPLNVFCDAGPIAGTVPLTVMYGAFDRAAQLYGAVNLVERRLLPNLRLGPSAFAFAYETTGVLGAIDVPTCVGRSVRGDLAAGGMGLGYRWGPVSLFYAGTTTWLSFFESNVVTRIIGSNGFPILGSLASPVAVFLPRVDFDEFSVSADFIVGAGLHLHYVDVLAGFVASRGLYAGIFQGQSRLFAGGALSDAFTRLPYARFGVGDLDWLYGPGLVAAIGSTSLYAERVEYTALPDGTVARDDYDDKPGVLFERWTAHFDQTGIAGGLFDVRAAMVVHPEVELYEATLTWRVVCLDDDEACAVPLTVGGGVMHKPTTWFYGTDGGYLPRAEIRLGRRDAAGITLGLNDPAVVTSFPFAYNAIFVRIMFSVGGLTEAVASAPPSEETSTPP